MASTYSDLKIQLMGTGDNSGTWGDITNTNLGTALEEAICESADVAFSQDSLTLTLSDVNTTQVARHLRLNLTGTGSAGITLTVPDIEKNYIINNTLATDVGIKNSSGAQVTVPNGRSAIVYSTGSGVVDAITSLNDTEISTAGITQLTVSNTTTFTGGVSAASVLNVAGNITGSSAVSDEDGNLRDVPKSGATKTDAYTFAIGDAGNHVLYSSANVNFTVPASTFDTGDVISVISTNGATATISAAVTTMFIAEGASATATATIGANGLCSLVFISASHVLLTGNVS